MKPIKPAMIHKVVAASMVLLTVLAGLSTEAERAAIFAFVLTIPTWALVLYSLGLLLLAFYASNYILWSESAKREDLRQKLVATEIEEGAKRENLRQKLAVTEKLLGETRRLRQIDVVTGIPNQIRLEQDIEELASKVSDERPVQIVMLDLDGFGRVNDIFGYRKGDDVIEYIAKSIQNTMRRNEEIYKRPLAGPASPDDLWRRIYRKYSGGDEFIFLLSGDESEALGFLLRLKRRFDGQMRQHIEAKILKGSWPLQFHAGVSPLYPDDTFDSAILRIEQCLQKARQPGNPSRVYWLSRKTKGDQTPSRVYDEAATEFALTAES